MCDRPVLHNRNQQAGPRSCITFQAFTSERLLDTQLCKINNFFDRSHQQYIATMNVSWAFCCWLFLSTSSAGPAVLQLRELFPDQKQQQLHSRIHHLTKYEWNRFLHIFILQRSWTPWATKKDSGSKSTCWRTGFACGTLLRRWNFLQTSAIWIIRVISCCLLLPQNPQLVPMSRASWLPIMHDQLAAIWMMLSFQIKKKSSGRTWSFFQLH